jgi:hypothetical protein
MNNNLGYYLLNVENIRIYEISVCHQGIDDTKWGRGMSIGEWLMDDDICSENTSYNIQRNIYERINMEGLCLPLRNQMKWSYINYYQYIKNINTQYLQYHRSKAYYINYEIDGYSVLLKLYGCLIPNQDYPIWYKGGIKITWKQNDELKSRFQVIKWKFCDNIEIVKKKYLGSLHNQVL